MPTPFNKEVSEILELIDIVHAKGISTEFQEAALDDIVALGGAVRTAWCQLNKDIRAGKVSWGKVQDYKVERYPEEVVEAYIAGAGAKKKGGSEAHGDNDDVDNDVQNEHLERPASSNRILTQAVTQMAKAVGQNQQAVVTMSNALVSSQGESRELLQEVVRLQKEIVQGQKNIVESQNEMTSEFRSYMKFELDAKERMRCPSSKEPIKIEEERLDIIDSGTPNGTHILRSPIKPLSDMAIPRLSGSYGQSPNSGAQTGKHLGERVEPPFIEYRVTASPQRGGTRPSTPAKRKWENLSSDEWSNKRHASAKSKTGERYYRSIGLTVPRKLMFEKYVGGFE